MSKFKSGDTIVATHDRDKPYLITYKGWTGTVQSVLDHSFSATGLNESGEMELFTDLNEKFFELASTPSKIPETFFPPSTVSLSRRDIFAAIVTHAIITTGRTGSEISNEAVLYADELISSLDSKE